jgi:exodeoxyribonuclease-3
LLCGDFNVAPDPLDVYEPTAWEGKVLFSLPEREALQAVGEWGLVDAFRQLNPTSPTYSWWDYRQAGFRRNLGVRIDHIWVTAALMQRCQQVTIDAEPRGWERPSDHTPVLARFDL